MLSTIVQIGGPAVALVLAYVAGFRVLLPGVQRANRTALDTARDQLQSARDDLERLHRRCDDQQHELEHLRVELSKAEVAALGLHARAARLQNEFTHQAAELATERKRSEEYLRMAYGLVARNAQLEHLQDRAVGRGDSPGRSTD